MKGEFKTPKAKYISSLLFILAGTWIAVRFALWGIDEMQAAHVSSAIFCFTFVIGGLLFGSFSIFIYSFNRNAYLTIENNVIDACFGWDKKLHVNISEITGAEIQREHLKLFVDGKPIWIYLLNNAKEICEYIRSQIDINERLPDIETAKSERDKCKKHYLLYLIVTVVLGAFLFLHIAWCAIMTEGKELNEFSGAETIIYIAFVFAEIFTMLLTFVFANKCGKARETYDLSKQVLLSAMALSHKNDSLDQYQNVIIKKYFQHYTYRIIVFSPKEDIYAYMLERFDEKTLSWRYCYESAKGFEILSELYDDLDASFADVILVD